MLHGWAHGKLKHEPNYKSGPGACHHACHYMHHHKLKHKPHFIPATMAVHTVSVRSLAPDVANMPIVQHACLLDTCEEDRV